ncbi:hypothetical protein E1B28_012147 [Marasmius oreades]|uniref:PH domain-containing protein n=1 Tax=Marasmius oreades TaxID=181124 RepID=A0A9P7RR18_9AGAR|nr:uncharacterized protein E1B28_012147 [Marasmius oreades]KAG7088122.1 hypothetical protein E1B28_012147 [Marasmius oreades]
MALAVDRHEQIHRYPWYWDDHTDYGRNEASFHSYHQNQVWNEKHISLHHHQNQILQGTKRPHSEHDENALVIVQGDLREGEQGRSELRRSPLVPLLVGSNLNLSSNFGTTTQAFSNTSINVRRPLFRSGCHGSGDGDSIQQPLLETRLTLDSSCFDSLPLRCSTQTPGSSTLIAPSSFSSPSLSITAFDDSRTTSTGREVRASYPLPQHLHIPTCTGSVEMVIDKRKRRWEGREKKVERQEVDGTATSTRFPQSHPHFIPLDTTTLNDMECIREDDEKHTEGVFCLGTTGTTSRTEEAVDGEERGRNGYSQSRSGYTNGGRSSNEYGYSNGNSNHRYSGGRGRTNLNGHGGDDGDDDDERGSNGGGPLDYYLSQQFSTSEEDESEDEESDEGSSSGYYAKHSMDREQGTSSHHYHPSSTRHPQGGRASQQKPSFSPDTASDEDDVPLAQSHPTALRAQQSIRIKDRQRRKDRKIEKARGEKRTPISHRDLGGITSTQEAMLHASIPSSSLEPPVALLSKTKMTSSPASSPLHNTTAFPTSCSPPQTATSPKIGDCTTLPSSVPVGMVRLRTQRGRTRTAISAGNGSNTPNGQRPGGSVPPTPTFNQTFTAQAPNPVGTRMIESQTPSRTLKQMRSFHVQRVNNSPQQTAQEWHANSPPVPVPTPGTPITGLNRSHTRGRSQHNGHAIPLAVSASAPPLPYHPPVPSVVPMTTSRARSRSRPPPTRNPYAADEFGQMSHSGNAVESLGRISAESRRGAGGSHKRSNSEHIHERVEVPPVETMPPLPPSLGSSPNPNAIAAIPLEAQQLRVYISTRQRFVMVEIMSVTNAGNVVGMVRAKGGLPDVQSGLDISSEVRVGGGWMVWEINADLGMERPIRPFEQLVEVRGSWNKEKTENIFMLKWTPGWEKILRREEIPPSAPTYSGYLEYEVRRGKWNKRWLVLRDHCLFISKRDNCKDQVLLCSLSNFDVYHFTNPPSKIPKEYAFGLKSTDKMSLFEDTNDYMHLFCCREGEGEKWVQRIRIARSYVLYQERNVLFASPPLQATPMSASQNGGGLGRALTTKRRAPIQPLVQVADGDIFAKGSLLRSQV